MTHARMLQEMSSDEFVHWMALANIDANPEPEQTPDDVLAMLFPATDTPAVKPITTRVKRR